MKIFKLSLLAVSVFLLSFGISNAQELQLLVAADEICEQGPPGSSDSRLYRVNPDTAAFQQIGPTGFNGVGALAQIGDGRLVAGAVADAGGDRISLLIEIDPQTGQGTLIGTSGSSNGPGCGRINDLTYDPATDTLYATGLRCNDNADDEPALLTIDPDTGAGTIIGKTGFTPLFGNALAISSNGTLFSSGGACPNITMTINPQTGVGTLLTQDAFPCSPIFNSATFSPFTGEFLGTLNDFPFTELAVLNPFTGDVNVIGQLPDCADGIEFVKLPPRPIPTLSEWGLIAMAGLLGIVGFITIRRRYTTA